MKRIFQLLLLIIISAVAIDAQPTYDIKKMYADNVYISGFSSVSGDTLFFSTQSIENNKSKYEIKYYLNGTIGSLNFIDDIEPLKIIHSNGEKFIITYNNKLYHYSNNTWVPVTLPATDYIAWDVKYLDNYLYLIPVTGEIYVSNNFGETWTRIFQVFTEGSTYSSIIFNNNLYIAKRDSLFKKEGNNWNFKLTDADETTNFEIEGMTFNNNNLFLFDSDNRIYKSVDTGLVLISRTANREINGLFVKDNEDIYISTDKGVFFKKNGQNDYVQLYTLKNQYKEMESVKKINKLVKINNNEIAAIIPTNDLLLSVDAGNSWRSILINTNNFKLNTIELNNNMIATANNSGVFFSDTTSKIWYEALGINYNSEYVDVHKYNNTFVAVTMNKIFLFNSAQNKWEQMYDSPSTISSSIISNDKLFIVTESGLYSSNQPFNNFNLANDNIRNGKLSTSNKLYLVSEGTAKELENNGQINKTLDLLSQNIYINDVLSINGTTYLATNSGLLKFDNSINNFTRIEKGINNNFIERIKLLNNRIYILDEFNNIYISNTDFSQFSSFNFDIQSTISDFTAEDGNIYLSTNNGAYWIYNIKDEIFSNSNYWVNKGSYLEHSKSFSNFIVPEMVSIAQKDIMFVNNTNTSSLVNLNIFNGNISSEINLTEKYNNYPNTLVQSYIGAPNSSLIKFAPNDKSIQDSIYKYNFEENNIDFQKHISITGLKPESIELSSNFVQIEDKILYYTNYQLDPNDKKSIDYNIYFNDNFVPFGKLKAFDGGFNGIIDKISAKKLNYNNYKYIVARSNNNTAAPAGEKAMISIFNENNLNEAVNINISNAAKITGIYNYSIDQKEYLIYSKNSISGNVNDDAIVLYDLKSNTVLNEIKGYRVTDLKGLGSTFAALATVNENNTMHYKLVFFYANNLEIAKEYDIQESFLGPMTVDSITSRILVFGKDGKLRSFENPSDDRILNADFIVEKRTVNVGETVHFINLSTGSPESVNYDFGDGSNGTNFSETHAYKTAGFYTITLSVKKNDKIDKITKVDYIRVIDDSSKYDFKADMVEGFAPFEVKFTEYGTEKVISRLWDFGDGETSTDINPTHNYTKTGVFTVKLFTDNGASKDTISKIEYIRVDEQPENYTADFIVQYTSGESPFKVKFWDATIGGSTEWLWDFGDGTTSNLRDPEHTFTEYGNYTISLQVAKDGLQSKTTKERYIRVSRGPIYNIDIKDEIELRDTTGNIVGMDVVENSDKVSVTFDVKFTDMKNDVSKGKVAFYDTKPNITDEKGNLRFINLYEAKYASNNLKFITPVNENKFTYISQFTTPAFKNFIIYNTKLNGYMDGVAQKYDMKANIVPIAYEKFNDASFVAFTVNDSALILSNLNEGGSANVKELFNKKHILNSRIPLLKTSDNNFIILYKSENAKLKYVIFNKNLDIIKNDDLFIDSNHYVVDAYFDNENNLIIAGEMKFRQDLDPYSNFIAKLDKNMNIIWSKDFTATFKMTGITELIDRWAHKRYVASGEIENNCAIFGFDENGDETMKLKLENRRGTFNNVINVNNGELIFTGGVYSNVEQRVNFYALHTSKINSYSSIKVAENNDDLIIYPNPSSGLIYTKDFEIKSIEVYDQTGRKVFFQNNPMNNHFDLSFLNNGYYSIVIRTGDNMRTGKFIISK